MRSRSSATSEPSHRETGELVGPRCSRVHGSGTDRYDQQVGLTLAGLVLITLIAPVTIPPRVLVPDWPFLVAATWLATFSCAGGINRTQGAARLLLYAAYIAASILITQ